MADAQPFRAVRYSGAAGRLADLVAPPYDAVGTDERERLCRRSPYNVLHLTLPESAERARETYERWLADGILEHEPEPAAWLLVEDFVGPDDIARTRRGVVVSLPVEPYGVRLVLPHERIDPGIREERLRLLRATGVQPEPILVLSEAPLVYDMPARPPDVEADGSRLWRLDRASDVAPGGATLLIADGHHRYASALALGSEIGRDARIMALVVAADDPGLHVFPTHRVFRDRPDLAALQEGEPYATLDDALAALADEPYGRAAAIAYRADRVELVAGAEDELDVALVDRHGLEGIAYTPSVAEAVAAVDDEGASVAYLLREPRVDDVFAVARRGELMPPKSTYFFPKPLAGLLFHPVPAA